MQLIPIALHLRLSLGKIEQLPRQANGIAKIKNKSTIKSSRA
jgi:hypothetical protein